MLAAQAPTIGIEPSRMPTTVSRKSGGRKSSRIGAAGWRAAPRLASHRGDSGSQKITSTPIRAGAAAKEKIQRHESGVMCQMRAICESIRMPPLSAAPISPATIGRDLSGQHSAASATALGHTPPTPNPTRNRSTSICSWVRTRAPKPANTE